MAPPLPSCPWLQLANTWRQSLLLPRLQRLLPALRLLPRLLPPPPPLVLVLLPLPLLLCWATTIVLSTFRGWGLLLLLLPHLHLLGLQWVPRECLPINMSREYMCPPYAATFTPSLPPTPTFPPTKTFLLSPCLSHTFTPFISPLLGACLEFNHNEVHKKLD